MSVFFSLAYSHEMGLFKVDVKIEVDLVFTWTNIISQLKWACVSEMNKQIPC